MLEIMVTYPDLHSLAQHSLNLVLLCCYVAVTRSKIFADSIHSEFKSYSTFTVVVSNRIEANLGIGNLISNKIDSF